MLLPSLPHDLLLLLLNWTSLLNWCISIDIVNLFVIKSRNSRRFSTTYLDQGILHNLSGTISENLVVRWHLIVPAINNIIVITLIFIRERLNIDVDIEVHTDHRTLIDIWSVANSGLIRISSLHLWLLLHLTPLLLIKILAQWPIGFDLAPPSRHIFSHLSILALLASRISIGFRNIQLKSMLPSHTLHHRSFLGPTHNLGRLGALTLNWFFILMVLLLILRLHMYLLGLILNLVMVLVWYLTLSQVETVLVHQSSSGGVSGFSLPQLVLLFFQSDLVQLLGKSLVLHLLLLCGEACHRAASHLLSLGIKLLVSCNELLEVALHQHFLDDLLDLRIHVSRQVKFDVTQIILLVDLLIILIVEVLNDIDIHTVLIVVLPLVKLVNVLLVDRAIHI